MLLNNQEITEENERKSKRYLETNDNDNMMAQILWDAAKEVLRMKFITIESHLKTQEKSEINNRTVHLKQLEKKEQIKPKVSREEKS